MRNLTASISNILFWVIFTPLTCLLIYLIVDSLHWRMVHDLPIMMYFAYLIDHFHYAPYRDFFDMNMPGTYFVYLAIGKIFGYGDFGSRIFDILYLVTLFVVTWVWMKPFGWKPAFAGNVLFGLMYLRYGPSLSLQREYLLILPISLSILLASTSKRVPIYFRLILIGLLFGSCAIIKPHSIIGFPLVLLYVLSEYEQKDSYHVIRFLRVVPIAIVGLIIPILILFFYLWEMGVLSNFLDIAQNYWHLYTHLTHSHQTIEGMERVYYLLNGFANLCGQGIWLVMAYTGIEIAFFYSDKDDSQKRLIFLLIGLAIVYSIYPIFSGTFWYYHLLIFIYFIVLLSALGFIEQRKETKIVERILPFAIFLLTIYVSSYPIVNNYYGYILDTRIAPKNKRVDQMAEFLIANLKPGDKVQPLDWTGGAVHAMLQSKAEIATPFIYDFHFYHHLSNPYIQDLRNRFMNSLQKSDPRFIIQISLDGQPWVSGEDTSREFRELDSFLFKNYLMVKQGEGYSIYERKSKN